MLNRIKKWLPSNERLKKNSSVKWILSWFSRRPYLWKFTKHSVAAGVAISLFTAFLPLPFEMLIVTLLAIAVHGNLPISILSTWLTNPFTLIPANYFSYKVGVWIIHNGTEIEYVPIERIKVHWDNWYRLPHDLYVFVTTLGKPYLIGLPLVSITTGLVSYALVYLIWTGCEWISAWRKK